MTPLVGNTNIYTPPPTLVATAIPGNNTVRVNPVNVSPAVSNVAINNDNRNGTNNIPANAQVPSAVNTAGTSFLLSPFIYTTPTTLSAGAQNTFFAQLISQDSSAAADNVLAEYEQLVAISFVKYRPSNATLPEPEPANLFGKMLQQQRQLQSVQQIVQQATQQTTANQAAAITVATGISPRETNTTPKSTTSERTANSARATAETVTLPRSAINAYVAVMARNDANKKPKEIPVEAI